MVFIIKILNKKGFEKVVWPYCSILVIGLSIQSSPTRVHGSGSLCVLALDCCRNVSYSDTLHHKSHCIQTTNPNWTNHRLLEGLKNKANDDVSLQGVLPFLFY